VLKPKKFAVAALVRKTTAMGLNKLSVRV